MALIGYFLNNKLLTKWFKNYFLQGDEPTLSIPRLLWWAWYLVSITIFSSYQEKIRYNGCLFVIASDQSYIDKIHLQALPGCGGGLFCFPLHFHSGRRCPQPEKGLNQSLLKGERNLVIKIFWIHVRNRRRDSIWVFEGWTQF